MAEINDLPEVLTPAEVGRLWRVDAKTVTRWADAGVIPSFRTLAAKGYGHRRFYRDDVLAQLNGRDGREEVEARAVLATLGELLDGKTRVEMDTEADGAVTVELLRADPDRGLVPAVHVHRRTLAEAILAASEEATS